METIKNGLKWLFYPLTYDNKLKMPKVFAAAVYVVVIIKIIAIDDATKPIDNSWLLAALVAGLIREGAKAYHWIEKFLKIWKGK